MSSSTTTAEDIPQTTFDNSDYEEYYGNTTLDNNSEFSSYEYFQFDLWEHYLKPGPKEWVVMFLYLIVFVVSLVGNVLIIVYILRRKNLQTTVYYFMLNLALADILITVIVLPPTVMVDVFESWLLGHVMCKLTPYFQMTVTSVSSLSLGAIAINRWFVVCHPLKVTAIRSATRTAVACMVAIWTFSLATLSPAAIVSELSHDYNVSIFPELTMLMSCGEVWESSTKKTVFHLCFVLVCYTAPLVVLSITYIKVFQELRKAEIPGYFAKNTHKECNCSNSKKSYEGSILLTPMSTNIAQSPPLSPRSPLQLQVNMWDNDDGQFDVGSPVSFTNGERSPSDEGFDENVQPPVKFARRLRKSLSLLSYRSSKRGSACHKCSSKTLLLRSRRKSATMQVTLIIVFGICYAPAMILDLMRRVFGCFNDGHRESVYFAFSIAHLIMYLNSALNPFIYNFFSSHFRKEFRKTFSCLFGRTLKRSPSALTSTFVLSKWERSRGGTIRNTERASEV